jgi:hypothetical protein
MVEEVQRQKFNRYSFLPHEAHTKGRDVRTDGSLPYTYQYRDPETNRTGIYDYDPRPPKGSIPRRFLRQRQPGIEQFNMRPPRQGVMGMDIASNYFQPDRSGIMQMADLSVFNTMKEGYDFINDHYNIDDNRINYEWNKPLWGGNLGVGGEYDFDDDDYRLGINWGTTWG